MTKVALEYAQNPVVQRRWIRRAIAAVALVAVLLCGARWGRMVWRKAKHEYAWHRCGRLDLPPDLVAYEEDWTAASGLLKSPHYHRARDLHFDPPWYPHPPAGFVPPACYVPSCYAWLDLPAPYDAIAFMHDRTTRNGVTRLISVGVMIADIAPDHEVALWPATYKRDARGRPICDYSRYGGSGDGDRSGVIHLVGGGHLTVFAGQADPNDASHFTLRYMIDGRDGMIDGWLRDAVASKADGSGRNTEWVDFFLRDGPATVARPSQSQNGGK